MCIKSRLVDNTSRQQHSPASLRLIPLTTLLTSPNLSALNQTVDSSQAQFTDSSLNEIKQPFPYPPPPPPPSPIPLNSKLHLPPKRRLQQ